jgi:hypothetical protein
MSRLGVEPALSQIQIWGVISTLTRSPYDVVHLLQRQGQIFGASLLSATLVPNSRFQSAVFYMASKRQDTEVEYNVSVYKFSNPVGWGIR